VVAPEGRGVSPDGHREQAKVLATLAGSMPAAGSTLRHGSGAAWGYGAHGERVYDWIALALDPAGLPDTGEPGTPTSPWP
jgi:hypothetical protein